MSPGAVAVAFQVPLTDVQSLAIVTFLTPTVHPITVVVIVTYRRQECVVALQQQCAQLRPAQTLQLMLSQCLRILGRVQHMRETASSPQLSEPAGSVEEEVFTQV